MRLHPNGGAADTRPVSGPVSGANLNSLPYNHPILDQIAAETEKKYGLPPGMLLAVKNAGETSGSNSVSRKGAKGVMQFMDATRAEYPHDPRDPAQSIDAGGRYLRDLLGQYGSPMAALAHYNGGHYNAEDVLAGREPRSTETRNYLRNIRGYLNASQRG